MPQSPRCRAECHSPAHSAGWQYADCVLDDLDYRLIALLRSNSRTPVAVLARELGVNRSTVTSRIDRLVDNGVIEGFTIRVSGDLEHDSVQGVMLVATENSRSPEIVRELRGYPELEQLHSTTGTWDLVLQIRARNLAGFDLVLERVRAIPGVRSTQTNLLFSSLRTV